MNELFTKIKLFGLFKVRTWTFNIMFESTDNQRKVFHYRILRYFRGNTDYVTCVLPQFTHTSKFKFSNNFKLKFCNEKIIDLPSEFLNYILKFEPNVNLNTFSMNIDNLLLNENYSIDTTLKLLDILIHIIPNITELNFYFRVKRFVEFWLKNGDIQNSFHLIQLLFFISLSNSSSCDRNIMQYAMDEFNRNSELLTVLHLEDVAILMNSFYRTGFRIKSEKVLAFISDNIENNLKDLLHDEAIFISLLKPLKSAKYQNRKLLTKISDEMLINNCIHFPLMAKTHLISLYNDSLYYDPNFIKMLLQSMEHDIMHMEIKDIRLKDISTFLWTLSYIGVKIKYNHEIKSVAVNKIESVVKKNLSFEQKKFIMSMLLSMWILKWDIDDLIISHVTTKSDKFWMVGNEQYVANYHLLETCLTIEAPHLYEQRTLSDIQKHVYVEPNIDKRLAMRFFFQKVFHAVRILTPVLNLQVQCVYNIPYIWICAIQIFSQKTFPIYVEVLDNSTCLRGTNIPNGLMMLKLRLEQKLQWKYILIDYMDPNYEETECLIEFIDRELKKLK